jgi:hypothetical protein
VPTLAELCPPPFVLTELGIHERDPDDITRTVLVCALP